MTIKLRFSGLFVPAVASLLLMPLPTVAEDAGQSEPAPSMTVNVETPTTAQWAVSVPAGGWLAAWQEAIVAAQTGPYEIRQVNVDVGSTVKQGDVLARLDDSTAIANVHKQEAEVASARASLAKAQADAARAREVKVSGALSGQDVNGYLITEQTAQASLDSAQASLEAEKLALDQTTVRAPDDGIVSSRSANLGNVVSSGTELFRLIRQGRVEWQAEVSSNYLPEIKPGMKATLHDPSGRVFTGAVRLVAPTVNTGTSRGIVYVELPRNADIRVGLYETGSIAIDNKPALTISETALVYRDGIDYVFVVGSDNHAKRVRVEVGRRQDSRVEILSGVTVKDRIVTSGGAFLADGALVRVQDVTE